LTKDSRDKLVMNTSEQQSEPPAIVVRMSCARMCSPPAPRLSRPSAGALAVATKAFGGVHVD